MTPHRKKQDKKQDKKQEMTTPMEPILETPRTREKRNRALRHMMLAWHLVQGLRAYARLQNNPQYNSFKERVKQGGQQLTGEDVHNLSVFFPQCQLRATLNWH